MSIKLNIFENQTQTDFKDVDALRSLLEKRKEEAGRGQLSTKSISEVSEEVIQSFKQSRVKGIFPKKKNS